MRFDRRRLLLSLFAINLVLLLVAVSSSSAEFDWFGLAKKKGPENNKIEEKDQQVDKHADGDNGADYEYEDEEEAEEEEESKDAKSKAGESHKATWPLRQAKQPNLNQIRSAVEEQSRLNGGVNVIAKRNSPKRPSLFSAKEEEVGSVQGNGRRWNQRKAQQEAEEQRKLNEPEDEDEDDFDDDEFEDEDGDGQANKSGARTTGTYLDRIANKKTRAELTRKFVTTSKVNADGRPKTAAERARELIEINRASPVAKRTRNTGGNAGEGLGQGPPASAAAKKNKLITGSFWQKKFDKAVKVTKKGLKESGKAIAAIPKYVNEATDSINAFWQLDGKGKILALINECNSDQHFVRKEFSQFTLSWSPIMEQALDYLGDKDLDKLTLDKTKDELDLRRDALHSLALGYEFMRLMIIWRENLLVAHEAFKLWLEAIKVKVEGKNLAPGVKRLEVDENLLVQLRTTHNYLLLTSWMTMEEMMLESRVKLDHLMEIEDDRPKNYESVFFRNIVVLQEMYVPTREEFDKERDQVLDTISESGAVVSNLNDVDAFFTSFRNKLATNEIDDFDWEVPDELTEFLAKLEPQLRRTTNVYSPSFLAGLKLRR